MVQKKKIARQIALFKPFLNRYFLSKKCVFYASGPWKNKKEKTLIF